MLSLSIANGVTSRLGRKTIATVLAIVPGFFGIFGLGHISLGETKRGIALLVIGIGLILIAYPGYLSFQRLLETDQGTLNNTSMIITIGLIMAAFAALAVWVWQIFDARKIATLRGF